MKVIFWKRVWNIKNYGSGESNINFHVRETKKERRKKESIFLGWLLVPAAQQQANLTSLPLSSPPCDPRTTQPNPTPPQPKPKPREGREIPPPPQPPPPATSDLGCVLRRRRRRRRKEEKMFYGAMVWDPWLIVSQIVCLQCLYYLALGLLMALLVGTRVPRLTLLYLFDFATLTPRTTTGWCVIAAFLLAAAAG